MNNQAYDRITERIHTFAKEGEQPENLTPEQLQELAGGAL